MFCAFETRADQIGSIAKDADYLEQAFQAKIYLEQGYETAQSWIVNIGKALRSPSALQLRSELQIVRSTDWRQGLKKIPTE